MPNSSGFYSLFIRELSLFVTLGCLPEERIKPQEVRINIELRFLNPPAAIDSDNIGDTISYVDITEALEKFCEGKEFKLIEKLAADLTRVTKEIIQDRATMSLTVHKVKPPILNLNGGTHFRIADFL